jgi:type VI secretion system secreted protein Hcp
MSYEFYVTIDATSQGKFKGESLRDDHNAKITGLSYSHEIQSPRDVATGLASGKRQHGPITFTKEWGPASPQLFQALVTNEILKTVKFEFIHTTPEGKEEVYFTIELENATVSSIKYATGMGDDSSASSRHTEAYDTHELETVSLTYKKITASHLPGKTSASDDWAK